MMRADIAARHSAPIRLEAVTKRFGGGAPPAVDAVDLAVRPGEFFSLLGPSGCGKTTTLRMIAGFERPTQGRVFIGDRLMNGVPVHRREIGMVFQAYALLPHRSVAENVAFGLRMRGLGRSEIAARVEAALAKVKLSGFGDRRIHELSGGQQQRVALARATVIGPPVLLCDEPLGALDRRLRQEMQTELKALQRDLGPTLVFVTHDQEEALAMSDRIGVMNAGRLEQVGAPAEIYDRPRTRFVAEFIGEIDLIEGVLQGGRFTRSDGGATPAPSGPDGPALLGLRPEKIALRPPGEGVLRGRVAAATFLGGLVRYRVETSCGLSMLVDEANRGADTLRAEGEEVGLFWRAEDAVLIDAGSPGA
jgi:putative spermidine/putrescine transport system ATP-binding protein